jgi:cytochrome P450
MMWKKAVALTQNVATEVLESPGYSVDDKTTTATIEINHWANKVTMDIIGIAGLGREFNALYNSDDELIRNYEEILEPTMEKVIFFACQVIFGGAIVDKLPWKLNERVKITTSNVKRITRQLVRDKREAIKADADKNFDILSVLIKSDDFSDEQLVDQMLTFLAAG